MSNVMIGSSRPGSGKTSIIVGMLASRGQACGYIKPLGDRLIYKRKRNWDYDSSLILELFDMQLQPESITLGFDHAKLRFMYDRPAIEAAVKQMGAEASKSSGTLIVEGGRDIGFGSSVGLDTVSVARYTGSRLYIVVTGNNDEIFDDIAFHQNHLAGAGIDFGGFIVNRVRDIGEFNDIYLPLIQKSGVKIAGVIPEIETLTYLTISYIAEKLHAKVIAGETALEKVVKNILVGAMSTDETMRNPIFNSEDKFLITSGDRSDMILAALERDTRGIVLTNNILPPANIIAKARENNVPMLLVTLDTFKVAKQIDRMEALLTAGNREKIELLRETVESFLDLKVMFG